MSDMAERLRSPMMEESKIDSLNEERCMVHDSTSAKMAHTGYISGKMESGRVGSGLRQTGLLLD